ncbi:MAG TPA: hypothetical protein VFV37_10540 [Luteibaculaceae bacterium]|nr:hypothetical protein [Luteibaculaceae bacterium]
MKWYTAPIALATLAFGVRIAMFSTGLNKPEYLQYIIFMHMLLVLLSVFFAARMSAYGSFESSDAKLKAELKAGIKGGLIYTAITAAMVFVYFSFIDINYFYLKQQQLIEGATREGAQNLDQVVKSVESFFTVGNWTTLTLLSYSMLTFIDALLLALVNKWMGRFAKP